MLVLSRKSQESIVIGDNIIITIVDIRGDRVRVGIEAPKDVAVHRREVFDAIQRQQTDKTWLVRFRDDLAGEGKIEVVARTREEAIAKFEEEVRREYKRPETCRPLSAELLRT